MTLTYASGFIPDPESSGEHLLSQDAGRVIGVGPHRVRQMVRDGWLTPEHVTPGGVRIFKLSDVLAAAALRERFKALRQSFRRRREEQLILPGTEKR